MLFRIIALTTLFLSSGLCAREEAPVYVLSEAEYSVAQAQTSRPSDLAGWESVQLPFKYEGKQFDEYIWFSLKLPQLDKEQEQAIYVSHHTYDIAIYLDGDLLVRKSRKDGKHVTGWNTPLFVSLPSYLIPESEQELLIQLRTGQPNSILSSVQLGSASQLKKRFDKRYLIQTKVSEWALISTLLLGMFTFYLWLKRPEDQQYILFSGMCVAWSVVLLFLALPYAPIQIEKWLRLAYFCVDLSGFFFFCFVNRVMDISRKVQEKVLFVILLLSGLVYAFALPSYLHYLSAIIHLTFIMFMTYVVVHALKVAYTNKNTTARYLGFGGLGVSGFVVIDIYQLSLSYETDALLPEYTVMQHGFFFLLVTLFLLLIQRFIEALDESADLNQTLENKIESIGLQLEKSYEETRALEMRAVAEFERQTIMRDLHDDIGAKMISILHSNDSQNQASFAREALRSMKGIVSQSNDLYNELITVLNVSFTEMEERLANVNIEYCSKEFSVSREEPVDINTGYHIARIVEEITSNIIKHSKATRVEVELMEKNNSLKFTITDNGIGFGESVMVGNGLKNIKFRAQQIGAIAEWKNNDQYGMSYLLEIDLKD